ncbi:MAG: hypothetical protein U0232_06795 [Thermomicrobiales bacterium]
MRPGLDEHWDMRIYLDIDVAQTLERGIERDLTLEDPAVRESKRADRVRVYEERYIPAEERYFREVDPAGRAEVVIDNRVLDAPGIVVRRRPV